MLLDRLGRPLRVLRLSLTDRCNFRCSFCMPPDREYRFLSRRELLTPEEIEKLVRAFVKLGVRKVRLTGGEPLLRKDLEEIVERISRIEGLRDVALTTNGYGLAKRLEDLKKAGLKRITVSIHSLDPSRNARIVNRYVDPFSVLEAAQMAREMGFTVKVNCVVVRGLNDDGIVPMAAYFKNRGITLRFIEFMDVGTLNDWRWEKVVSAEEILSRLAGHFSFYELPRAPEDTALRYRYTDNGAEFGIVASVTRPFCRGCDRIRVSADGKIYTCLFSSEEKPLSLTSPEESIVRAWTQREDRYSELRWKLRKERKVEMFKVGG